MLLTKIEELLVFYQTQTKGGWIGFVASATELNCTEHSSEVSIHLLFYKNDEWVVVMNYVVFDA